MDNSSPELIEARMAETRQSLTEKVTALEESVVGTVQSATTAVQDTVQTVRAAVEGTVESVRQQLGSAFDVRRHVQDHPWLTLASASAAGFFLGLALRSGRRGDVGDINPVRTVSSTGPTPTHWTGLWDSLAERFTDEVKKVGESAIQCLSTHLHRIVANELPGESVRPAPVEEKATDDPTSTYPIGRWNGTHRASRM